MKKYLVIGNPIEHSLSPKLHNHWFKHNNIEATYIRQKLESKDLKNIVSEIREGKLHGVNITVPFKNEIIPFLDKLSPNAEKTQSVNTLHLDANKVVGYNTDIDGFELAIKDTKFNLKDKKIIILGAGGVVPSIIFALNKMKVFDISISNRTQKKAEDLNKFFNNLKIVDWGTIPNFDMIINATSIGLSEKDQINFDFSKLKEKKFFYDVIYNPTETNFLKNAKIHGNYTENGMKMFLHQAATAFRIWHGIKPEIEEKEIKLLSQ